MKIRLVNGWRRLRRKYFKIKILKEIEEYKEWKKKGGMDYKHWEKKIPYRFMKGKLKGYDIAIQEVFEKIDKRIKHFSTTYGEKYQTPIQEAFIQELKELKDAIKGKE